MALADIPEAIAGGALLFALPGLAVTRAVFPEWRFAGPGGLRRAVETATLGFVLSVALTVLVGGAILGIAPGGFSASWGNPLLEAALAAVTVLAFAVGAVEGAYGRHRPSTGAPEARPDEEGAWELSRALERLDRQAAQLAPRAAAGNADAQRELTELGHERDRLASAREADYAR